MLVWKEVDVMNFAKKPPPWWLILTGTDLNARVCLFVINLCYLTVMLIWSNVCMRLWSMQSFLGFPVALASRCLYFGNQIYHICIQRKTRGKECCGTNNWRMPQYFMCWSKLSMCLPIGLRGIVKVWFWGLTLLCGTQPECYTDMTFLMHFPSLSLCI